MFDARKLLGGETLQKFRAAVFCYELASGDTEHGAQRTCFCS